MNRASGLQLGTSGSESESRIAHAVPVQVSSHGGGAPDEDERARARRRRLRWQIACGAAFALAIASFAIVIVSSVYEARASVLIRPPGADAAVPRAVGGALQSEVEILQSFDVLRQALESIRVEVLYPGLDGETPGALRAAAVARMREALAVRTLPESDVIEVRFRHVDAQLAADVVNRLVERFRRSRPDALAPTASRYFLHERIQEQRETLATAETALAAFQTEHPELAASDPRGSLAARRLALEGELRAQRHASDGAQSASRSDDASVLRARARLDELELELQQTLRTHVEGSRTVSKLRDEIERVRDHLAEKERLAAQEEGRGLRLLRSRQHELEAQLAELGRAELELPELERRGRELARERDVAARRLEAYQREFEAATLAADVGEHEVEAAMRVLEPAHPPETRIIPAERSREAWALVGSALIVLLGALGIDVLDQRRTGRPPLVFAASVGAGAQGGALSLVMPGGERGAGAGPVVLLLQGRADGAAAGRSAPDPDPGA